MTLIIVVDMGAISEILERFGNETVNIIRTNLSSTGSNATGETSQSVRSEVFGESKLVVSGKPFIMVVETGRKEGKPPPISPIIKWLQSGKVTFEGSIRSAAFAISKAIGKSGTRLYQTGGRRDIITPAVSDQRVDALIKEVADETLKQTITVIERAIDGSA